MICDMNHAFFNLRLILRAGVLVLFLGVAIVGSVLAGVTDAHRLPEGITVSVDDDATGRNATTIRIGTDILAVDFAHGPKSGQTPQYWLFTDALEGVKSDASIELWPRTRPRDDATTKQAAVVFSSGFTLAAADREVVLFDLGRCASAGDAAVWLPTERVLITGRVASRGRVEATLDTDLVSWIGALERLRGLNPAIVVPGHGNPGGVEILDDQVDRLTTLRDAVKDGLLSGRTAAGIVAGTSVGWFSQWRAEDPVAVTVAVEAMVAEVGGLRTPWELSERRGLREGNSPTRNDPDWRPPKKVLWRDYWPERLPLLALVAPEVEIVPFESGEQALEEVADADAIIGSATPELLAAGSKLRWVQVGSAGVERYLEIPKLGSGEVLLTNGQKLASPEIAEHVMALTRALARGLGYAVEAQMAAEWRRSEIASEAPLQRLRGKTMLVVGLGGIGTEVARLASAAEMRVTGIRSSRRSGPPFVDQVGLTEDLGEFAAEADVVVNCLPMTPDTADIFDAAIFHLMKPTAFFVNVGRGGTVDTEALVSALVKGEIAGAGLDVTDPEPLPAEHPLWKAPNIIITPHYAAWSDIGRERRWLLYRENLRRFVTGEPLLSVVDPKRGY
jgi:phosphoglycerate dehydrogenase-like enzyme/glyoxylase-like metal-dependent hydrolase (beta-lactamase superfamily II)